MDLTKLKAFADDQINASQMTHSVLDNIVGKGENACYQHFLLFHNVFNRLLSLGCLNLGLCGKELRVKVSLKHSRLVQ